MILRSLQPLRYAETGFHAHPPAFSGRAPCPVKHGEQKCVVRAAAAAEEQAKYGVLLEVDKALVDTHTQAHRVAFNQAFKELGYKTVTWTPELFWQLLRSAAATPDSLVTTYYNTLGWPVGLDQPQERQQHTERILQKKDEILGRMVDEAAIPLRPGAQDFLADAIAGGATVALLASTCSAPSERIVDAALTALGPELSDNVRIFQCPQSSTSTTDASQSEEDPPSFEQSLQNATAKRRQEEAQVFLDVVNRSKLGSDWREKTAANDPGQLAQRHVGEGLGMDPSLLVANLRFAGLNPAWLAACCATLDISLRRFALLGGSNSLLKAAQGAGIFSVAVPTYLSGRGSYSADVVADSYGAGGGVTFSKLRAQIDAGGAAKRARGRRA